MFRFVATLFAATALSCTLAEDYQYTSTTNTASVDVVVVPALANV